MGEPPRLFRRIGHVTPAAMTQPSRKMEPPANPGRSNLHDVLAYIACARPTTTREERVDSHKHQIFEEYGDKQYQRPCSRVTSKVADSRHSASESPDAFQSASVMLRGPAATSAMVLGVPPSSGTSSIAMRSPSRL